MDIQEILQAAEQAPPGDFQTLKRHLVALEGQTLHMTNEEHFAFRKLALKYKREVEGLMGYQGT